MRVAAAITAALLLGSGPALSQSGDTVPPLIVEKQVFEIESFTTQGGATIPNVRVGWEAYGTLNEAKDNVILIAHYYTGSSHAAGRYSPDDASPGYWDYLIGPGKAIDTDRFYVVSMDTLVNLGVHDPNVITTGPASENPATGKPWGMDFPVVTIRDFVEVQRAFIDSLGVEKLHAVMGASMGSLQAYEWASAYPDRVERLIPVIGAGWANGDLIAWLNLWAAPIRLDPNWNGGDYYDGAPPNAGLAEALKMVTLHAQHWEWSDGVFGRAWADEAKDPAAAMENLYRIEAVLDQVGAARAAISDANHFLYLAKANQVFMAGHGGSIAEGLLAIEAPTLIIHTEEDQVFAPEFVQQTAAIIGADGTPVRIVEIDGTRGHLDGVLSLGPVAPTIKAFLEE